MKFFVVVKVRLARPFDHWKQRYDAHTSVRRENGIFDRFAYPIIGEQGAIYAVETENPRRVHEMIYDDTIRPDVEQSGFVIGQEIITVCELTE